MAFILFYVAYIIENDLDLILIYILTNYYRNEINIKNFTIRSKYFT